MYSLSSQKKFWTFKTEQELAELRVKQNVRFIAKHGASMTVSMAMFCARFPQPDRIDLKIGRDF